MATSYAARFCRLTLAACLLRAVRVFLGRCAIVFFFFAAAAAFLMFLLAAALCLSFAITEPPSLVRLSE